MATEILSFEQAVDRSAPYADEPWYVHHLRSDAARSLAEHILEDASLYRRIEPKKDEMPLVRHRWTIGIERNVTEIEMRERELAAVLRQAMSKAAAKLEARAAEYERAGRAWPSQFIADVLHREAKKLRSEADSTIPDLAPVPAPKPVVFTKCDNYYKTIPEYTSEG